MLAVIFLMFALFLLVRSAGASTVQRVPEPAASAIRLAAVTYNVPESEMVAVAKCETGSTFDPRAFNKRSGASGLFQFLRSTWAHTPYRSFSVFDAHANALAAAWLYVQDNRSWREWTCRPT